MKVLFVGDNRSNPNWGGRGASQALYRLLSERFEISSTITGDQYLIESSGHGYVGPFCPPRLERFVNYAFANRARDPVVSAIARLQRALGTADYVHEDPEDTADAILRHRRGYPWLRRIHEQVTEADALVVNGEGDLVFTTPPRRETLFLLGVIALGLRLKKRVLLVNALVSDCPDTGRNVRTMSAAARLFVRCESLIVRDPQSAAYVREEMPGVLCDWLPDSLFTWFPLAADAAANLPKNGDCVVPFPEESVFLSRLDFSRPYICIGGSAAAARDPRRATASYLRFVELLRGLGVQIVLTKNDGPDVFLEDVARETGVGIVPVYASIFMAASILAHARLFVSGRYHPTILASLGGAPCLFLATTAHKMTSLQDVLEYEKRVTFSPFPSEDEAAAIVSLARDYLDRGEALRKRIRDVAARRCEEALMLPDRIAEKLERSATWVV